MENQNLQRLFSHYIDKIASPEEVKLLLEHFRLEDDSDILKDIILKEMSNTATDGSVTSFHEHAVYDRVEAALNLRIKKEQEPLIKTFWQISSYRIAASVAAIFLLVSGYVLWNNSRPQIMLTASAPYGKTMEIILADSSKVLLNAGTTISYPINFKTDTRSITLINGDAFFAVVHDQHKPFIVKSNGINVTVLGTSFEVNSFGKDTRIAVKGGKVGVLQSSINRTVTFLLPGQGLVINHASHRIKRISVDTADIAAWREQRLIFDDQPLVEVMQSLERKYNVHIEIKNDRLLTEKVSMRLNNQSLNNILTALSFSKHFTYEINDQLIVIK